MPRKKKEKITSIRPDVEELEPIVEERPYDLYFVYFVFASMITGLVLRLLGVI
jgi:hypothetical protein